MEMSHIKTETENAKLQIKSENKNCNQKTALTKLHRQIANQK